MSPDTFLKNERACCAGGNGEGGQRSLGHTWRRKCGVPAVSPSHVPSQVVLVPSRLGAGCG